jgi:hypothetical protein
LVRIANSPAVKRIELQIEAMKINKYLHPGDNQEACQVASLNRRNNNAPTSCTLSADARTMLLLRQSLHVSYVMMRGLPMHGA